MTYIVLKAPLNTNQPTGWCTIGLMGYSCPRALVLALSCPKVGFLKFPLVRIMSASCSVTQEK